MNQNSSTQNQNNVVDFTELRQAKIEEKKRKYERVLFQKVLGAYCVAEGIGLKAIELVDVSLEGLSFQLPFDSKNNDGMSVGKEMTFRIYFSEDSYIPIGVRIQNERPYIENGQKYIRYGCSVDTSLQSYEAYKLFVQFLTKYAELAQIDSGEVKLFFF
jgi:hypothetical protein